MAKTKKLRKYRLRPNVGPHFEPNPDYDRDVAEDEDNVRDIEYGPGDVVTSTRALDKIFVNKFDPVGDTEASQTPGGDVPVDPKKDPNKDRPVRSTEDANVNRGNRFLDEEELEGKEDLQKLSKGQKVEDLDEDASEEDEEVVSKKRGAKEEDEEEDLGDDVTEDFDVGDSGLKVRQRDDGKFYVSDKKGLVDGSKKGLSRLDAKKFLKKHVQK